MEVAMRRLADANDVVRLVDAVGDTRVAAQCPQVADAESGGGATTSE